MPSKLDIDEESQMRGEGWKRALTLKWVSIQGDGMVYVEEIDFFADRMPCRTREGGTSGPQCGVDHTWLKILNGKVFWSCFRHQIVNGPLAHSIGYSAARYAIPPMKAVDTCKETGQDIPPRLISMVQEARAKGSKKRRRPSDVE